MKYILIVALLTMSTFAKPYFRMTDFEYEVKYTNAEGPEKIELHSVENRKSDKMNSCGSGQIQVNGEGVNITKVSGGKYSTKPKRVGNAKITIYISDTTSNYFILLFAKKGNSRVL